MTTNQSTGQGHYHDPQGKYYYCDDPRCPRSTVDLLDVIHEES